MNKKLLLPKIPGVASSNLMKRYLGILKGGRFIVALNPFLSE